MIFSRKMIFVVGAALLAACGDKVTVQDAPAPVPPVLKINSVTIAPATATLTIGQTLAFTAAVNADAGVVATIVWSSSDATKASVLSGTGVVTAVAATPGVAICAEATAGTQKVKGCSTVVVQAATAVVPATVSIHSITFGGLNTPVNPANVFGQMDVTLNGNPGNQVITKVELLVGGVVAGTQIFTAAQAAAFRFAADEAIAAQTTFPQIVFSVNTACFEGAGAICNALKPTDAAGAPVWMNGTQAVQAKVYTTTSGAGTAATASAVQTLTFNNANAYVAMTSASGTPAIGANGYKYSAGNIVADITPVIYTSGVMFSAGTITFGAAGCDVTGPRTIALAAGTAPAWTATFTNSVGASAATNFRNYELRTATPACPLATGEGFTVTATDNNGNQLFAATAPANNTTNLFRMDNVAPAAPTLTQNPGARQNGWVNADIGLTTTTASSATNGMVIDGAADLGVGGRTRWVRVAAATGGLVDDALAATAGSPATLPAPSAANSSYCAVFSAKDALGNESARPAAGTPCSLVAVASATVLAAAHTLLGVDIAPPTILFSGGLASSARLSGATVAADFQVTVSDTGIVGNSGMLATGSVIGTVGLRNATATGAATCWAGVYALSVCGNTTFSGAALPLVSTATVGAGAPVGASVTTGYYTYTGASRDAAGNVSGTVTRAIAYDLAANIPALTTALFSTPLTGPSVTFNANASDNFDLRDVTYNLAYAGGLVGPIVYPTVVINAFNVSPLLNTNVAAGIVIPNFVRQIEDVTGNNPVTVGGAFKPLTLNGAARDQANNSSGNVPTGIPGASVTTGVSYLLSAAPQLVRSFAISNAATNISNGAGPLAAVNPTSVTINADVFGATATFNPPFARVDLYAVVGGQLVQVGTTTSYTTVDDGSAFGRRHRFAISWTPGASFALGASALYAIGVNSVGDALVTLVSANITVTYP